MATHLPRPAVAEVDGQYVAVDAKGAATTGPIPRLGSSYILDDKFLLCLTCKGAIRPAPNVDGTRSYSCDPSCTRPAVDAVALGLTVTLAALVREARVLLPDLVLRSGEKSSVAPARWGDDWLPVPDADEVQRWRQCRDLHDRRGLVRTVWAQVTIDIHGEAYGIWH